MPPPTNIARLAPCRHARRSDPSDPQPFDAHCIRCGQYLGCIDPLPPPHLVVWSGWHFDGEIWRPSNEQQRRRRQDEAMLAARRGSDAERAAARRRLRENEYGRPGDGREWRRGVRTEAAAQQGDELRIQHYLEHADELDAASVLPLRVMCPTLGCGLRNIVLLIDNVIR